MNRQEVFTRSLNHLRFQGHQSLVDADSKNSACLYLDPNNGDKCALGIYINDYDASIEDNPISGVMGNIEFESMFEDGFFDVGGYFLTSMQVMHDDPYFMLPDGNTFTHTWMEAVEEVAKKLALRWDLKYTPPAKAEWEPEKEVVYVYA